MADGEEEGEEGEEGEKRLVDLRRLSLMASPQVKKDRVGLKVIKFCRCHLSMAPKKGNRASGLAVCGMRRGGGRERWAD